ncbi:MAG: glycosyltransferase family 2 protein [Prevotella sp.]|nr:glycosyltransferase family 2 protein [Prevotella sp.]
MLEENKISVVINTYNAERHLREVLEAVKWFDETVVCDMESTDSTVSIARQYGCRVVTYPKGDSVCAEPARTFAIQSATSKWVLVVDADEIVTPELRQYLYRRIAEADCPEGLYIPRRNRFMNRLKAGRLRDFQLRFFIREGTVWPPYVHTFPQVNGRVEKIEHAGREVCFVHLAENTLHEVMQKTNDYTDGEVAKKSHKHYGIGALLWRPVWRFFKSYFMDGNIRNGLTGFIESSVAGIYQFLMVAKMLEQRMKDRH